MRDYQFEKVKEEPDKALTEDTRVLTDEDIMRYIYVHVFINMMAVSSLIILKNFVGLFFCTLFHYT